MNTIKFKINNLHCEGCISTSKKLISEIPGVKEIEIKDVHGETEIKADREIGLDEVQKALEGTEYKVTDVEKF